MEISITRALAELKLSTKKIEDKTEKLSVAAHVNKDHGKELRDNFLKDSQANLQKIQDLIKRRNDLKIAIVASNAATLVTVGGDSMTVAAAIERKTSISFEKALERKMRETYYANKAHVEQQNIQVKEKADKQAESVLPGETARDKGEEYTLLVNAYIERNKVDLISVEDAEKLIDDMQDKIDEFESEVDFILSESNTRTMIDV